MTGLTVTAENSETEVFGRLVSELQTNVSITNMQATGILKYLSSGAIVNDWGPGNFIVLKFSASDWSYYDSVKVGLDPSQGSGLVEIKNDPDKNGVFKVTNKDMQNFKIVLTKGNMQSVQYIGLSGLTCEGG